MYVPSLISIPFVLSKIGQASIMKKKWLWGDNSVNMQDRFIVVVHCPFPHCYLSINQVSYLSLWYVPTYGPDRHSL